MNQVLCRPDIVKDFVIIFDSFLSFNKHMEETAMAATRILGFIEETRIIY